MVQDIDRPQSLETRMAAIADILSRDGFKISTGIFQAMCWWEESISPHLNQQPVGNLTWKRTRMGPRAHEIDDVIQEWENLGLAKLWEDSPVAHEDLKIDRSILEKGQAVSGVDAEQMIHTSPSKHTKWYALIEGFVCGFTSNSIDGERINVSAWSTERDILMMLKVDQVFTRDPWESAGGPGHVYQNCKIKVDDGSLFEAQGNTNTALMQWAKSIPQRFYRAESDYSAAWYVARQIAANAKQKFALFADQQFYKNYERLSFRESEGNGLVKAEFFLENNLVARASWQQSWRTNTYTVGEKTYDQKVEDHLLLDLEVVVGQRNQGIGTYVMRHALTKGCARSLPPHPSVENLWREHGWPNEEEWELERSGWPTCQPYCEPSNVVQFLAKPNM